MRVALSVCILSLLANSSGVFGAKLLVQFDLPKGSLSDALIHLAKQAELSLLVPKSSVAERQVEHIKGVMTPSQALNRLLAGTGLGYKFVDSGTVSISADFPSYGATLDFQSTDLHDSASQSRISSIVEVIVTAQRTAQNLQKVPMAISVLNQAELQHTDVKNLSEIGTQIPGLTISSYSLGQPTIHMRGIGSNDDGAAMDNSVAIFADDVYVGRITHIDLNILDIEQIEVLRGPQGTLYGKNAIGGAIKLVSKSPGEKASGEVKLSSGNLAYQNISGSIDGPIGLFGDSTNAHTLLGRLSFDARRRDGWQENLVTHGDKQHNDNKWGLRGKLLLRRKDNLEIHWGVDGSQENLNASGRIPVRSSVPVRILDSNGNLIPRLDALGNPLFENTPSGPQPLYETKLPTDIFRQLGGDPKHATNDGGGFTDRKIWGLTQRLIYDTAGGTFTAISGYRSSRFDWAEESTGLPSSTTDQTLGNNVLETHRQYSQEFRWASVIEGKQSYVVGIYYLNERTHRNEGFPFQTATARSDQRNRTDSYALFGELHYMLSPQAELNLGGRYTYDVKNLRQSSTKDGAPAVILEDFQVQSEGSWNELSPRLALSYHADNDLMYYGSIAFGMKSGGFQGAPGTREIAQQPIEPESAWDYELGFKSQWLQDLLRLNMAAFYTDYRNLQVVQFRTINNFGVFQTDNAAFATVRGLEAEFILSPTQGLTLSGYYAFLRATYDSYNDPDGRDFTGNRLRQAPKHSLNLVLRYQFPSLEGRLSLQASYYYQSKSFREPDNNVTIQPAYRLFDTTISYKTQDRRWETSLWAKNIFNEEYISHLFILGGNDYALFGTPRTYGVTLAWHFL